MAGTFRLLWLEKSFRARSENLPRKYPPSRGWVRLFTTTQCSGSNPNGFAFIWWEVKFISMGGISVTWRFLRTNCNVIFFLEEKISNQHDWRELSAPYGRHGRCWQGDEGDGGWTVPRRNLHLWSQTGQAGSPDLIRLSLAIPLVTVFWTGTRSGAHTALSTSPPLQFLCLCLCLLKLLETTTRPAVF